MRCLSIYELCRAAGGNLSRATPKINARWLRCIHGQQHKRWHLKGSTLAKCTGYINSVWLKALLAFTVWVWMYNNEAARVRMGIGGVAGREMTNKKEAEERGGGDGGVGLGGRGGSFMSPLSLKGLPFMWALSYSVCSHSISSTSPAYDKDITLFVQRGGVGLGASMPSCANPWASVSDVHQTLALGVRTLTRHLSPDRRVWAFKQSGQINLIGLHGVVYIWATQVQHGGD